MIDGDIRRDMAVDIDQKHHETFEAAANILCQLKKIYQLNKGHYDMDIQAVKKFYCVYSFPLLESIVFDTDIYDGVAKMRAATLLGEILRPHQQTKNPLKYAHTDSNYGHLVAIPTSETQESFSRAARDKVWVDKNLLRYQVERRKIRWPWHNTRQSICLRNMKMKQFLLLLNVVCLSTLP